MSQLFSKSDKLGEGNSSRLTLEELNYSFELF